MNQKKKTQKEYTSEEEKREKKYQELFPKEKGEKRFKRDKRKINAADVARFNADIDEGLSKAQVEERTEQGLVNRAQKKFSKTYRSIFVGNICTFFNLLCLLPRWRFYPRMRRFRSLPSCSFSCAISRWVSFRKYARRKK